MPPASTSNDPLYRIGAVSRLSGVPVSTLRVWEVRYGAFKPVKTSGKQRLFGEHDVAKAVLLKQLVHAGHAISTVAPLELEQLSRLSTVSSKEQRAVSMPDRQVNVAVVGTSLANRIESSKFASRWCGPERFKVTAVFEDLDVAGEALFLDSPHLLLIKANTLHSTTRSSIEALIQKHGVARTVVIYNFAPDAVVQVMKFAGVMVRREPITDMELAELMRLPAWGGKDIAEPVAGVSGAIPARRYSDETLSRVATISTHVLCECPRHVAELLAQLASFEDYCQECLNKSPDDAHLHAYLRSVSGSARHMFETALQKIAQHEGITLT